MEGICAWLVPVHAIEEYFDSLHKFSFVHSEFMFSVSSSQNYNFEQDYRKSWQEKLKNLIIKYTNIEQIDSDLWKYQEKESECVHKR